MERSGLKSKRGSVLSSEMDEFDCELASRLVNGGAERVESMESGVFFVFILYRWDPLSRRC